MSYNADSIKIKDFATACRDTPAMYLGDDRQNGVFNAFLEILNNACDEAIMKRGNLIVVDMEDDCLQIEDYGRGVPHGPNADCEEVLIELFTKSHSSGKFDNTNYKKVRGLHGVGSSAVCVCSKVFEVWTKRDGYTWYMKFVDGAPAYKNAMQGDATSETGTIIKFTPDKDIFHLKSDEKCFDYQRIRNELELTSYFIPNVTFKLKYNGKTEVFCSKNGLKDFAASRIRKPLHKNYIYGYREFDDEVEVEVFAQWTDGKEESYVFSNGALNSEGGTPITGAKAAFTRTINSLAKSEFDADMIRKGLVYIINIRHPHPIYQNQVKNKIQNPELRGYTQTVFGEAIKDFAIKHKDEFDSIVEILKKEKKAEAAAERARKQVLEAVKDVENEKKKRVELADKLKDCQRHGSESGSVLAICEGDSALGALVQARPIDSVALMPIRGKIISALKHEPEKILKNEEVKAIFSALGCGFFERYNSKKLRYQYVAIAADQDPDGKNIGCLLITLFYYMCPELIKEGRLLWMQMPLHVLTYKDKVLYAFSDFEKNEMIKKHGKPKEIGRKKGIGENTPEETKEAVFGAQKRWWQLCPKNNEDFSNLIQMLMGKDVEERKDFIMKNVDFSLIGE